LGLDPDTFDHLSEEIDVIYHNGAWVNFIEPYYRLRGPNVTATREILRLACSRRTKVVHYISSSSVYGTVGFFTGIKTLHEDDDIALGLGYGFGGYVQSKWVSERMVWNAGARGLPITVFRCALVMGHSRTGIANIRDFPSRLIKGCIELGSYYRLRNKYDNFVPVDFASQAIVQLSLDKASLGRAFHIVNPHHITYGEFWELIREQGYPMEELDYRDWTARFVAEAKNCEGNALYPLLPLFIENIGDTGHTIVELFQDVPTYDTCNVDRELEGTRISCPRLDADLISTWLSYYISSGFINPPNQ
jgi:thioester reductase-like protein